jgi:putative membrane protein
MNSMIGWLGAAYMPVKALHVVATFFWIAGLFMLPRYLAYQVEAVTGSAEDQRWTERTARLRRIILTPTLILVWVLGLMLALSYGLKGAGWIHAKILLVLLLSAYHGWMVGVSRRMAGGSRPLSGRTLRLLNEVPALFTIALVFIAVMKPF